MYGNVSDTNGFGQVVVLGFDHDGVRRYAAYCHLSGTTVAEGAEVRGGDQVGFTGNSGNAVSMSGSEEHLHFEIRSSVRPPAGGAPARVSPMVVFGVCPLNTTIIEP